MSKPFHPILIQLTYRTLANTYAINTLGLFCESLLYTIVTPSSLWEHGPERASFVRHEYSFIVIMLFQFAFTSTRRLFTVLRIIFYLSYFTLVMPVYIFFKPLHRANFHHLLGGVWAEPTTIK